MQPNEDPSARCRSSTDASLPFPVESKGVDIRRFRHGLDPRYSVYRWDCGSYPYFKAPVPTSAAPCPGVQPAFAPNNLGYPGGHVPNAPDIFCDGRGDCYGGVVVGSSGQDFMHQQPQRCICPDTHHDPRYHPQHLESDALNWDPRSAAGGCLCCGQHVSNPHGPRRSSQHPPARHLDSSGRLFQPVYRAVVAGPDVVHVYPNVSRKSIDPSRLQQEGCTTTGAQCLPSSSSETSLCIGSAGQRPEQLLRRDDGCGVGLQQMENKISSTPHAVVPYTESVSTENNRDVRLRSNGGRDRETTGASSIIERVGSITTDHDDDEDNNIIASGAMKNIGSVTNEEQKRSDLNTGKISDTKITPTRSSSKVTPLYGLPSWWGDEPVPDFDQKRKYSYPTVTSSPSSSDSPTKKKQTEHSDRVPIATARTSLSNSNPPDATTKDGSLGPTGIPAAGYSHPPIDAHGLKHSQSNKDLGHYPIIFENPGPHQSNSRNPPHLRNSESHGSLGNTFEIQQFSNSPENNFERSPISASQHRSLQICGHHSPPERDRPSTVDGDAAPPPIQHFLYPDPLLPLPVERDFRLVTCGDDCGGPLKCKAPTAFIVDLQEIDDNDNDNDNDDNSQRRSITVKTSLRQFLPRRCERSLQRRLSWMKQNRKPHSATERGEGRTEMETSGGGDMVAATTDPRQRFRLSLQRSSSFKDSFEEAVASDAIADDVSEAGTYTIDVSSDGESVAVADARERILATFGITGIEDEELEKEEEWTESGKGYFEKNWDRDSSKKDGSLKSRTNRKPAMLNCDNTAINDSRSNATEPVTPTAESYTWSFSEAFTPPPPPPSKNELPAQDDVVLTIYTETAAGCSITRSVDQRESHRMILHEEGVKCPPQRPRCLDTSVLLTETDRSTLDAGCLLLEPDTVASSCYANTMQRHIIGDEACFSLGSNKAGPYLFSPSTAAASESGRIILPTDRDYFKIPLSSYSGPVSGLQIGVVPAAGILSDAETLDPGLALRRKSSAASASGDSLESPGRVSTTTAPAADQMSESGVSSNNQSLLCNPEKDKAGTIRTGDNGPPTNTVEHNSCGNSIVYNSDSDEDGSPVDPVVVKVPAARTVNSIATEVVTVKPTEESVQVIVGQKSRTTRKSVEESREINHHPTKVIESHESPAKHAEIIRDKKQPRTSNLIGGPKTQLTSPITDKPLASRHPKTKPPTPKSFPKSPSFPDGGHLASRRCFSDLDVAGHDETSSEATASPMASEGKGIGGKGTTTTSSVEHTRMNRTFALRCARREASDGTAEANRSDNQQRSARTTKKSSSSSSSSSKFDDAQRSRSASRSRPGGASPRSLFESSRSADTSLNLGQRTVKKSQEMERKTRQTTDTMSRSLTRDDDSSSQKSPAAATFRPPNAIKTAAKKKNVASDRGKDDMSSEGASGVTVKGSPGQSRPLSSSMTVPEAAAAGNEWTRRKKYNPRQSLPSEVSLKKTGGGKPDGKPIAGSVDKTESKPRNRKKVADGGGKNTPSTPSDWTDDEKLQLTPRGRDLPAVCQLSAKVKLLSDQVLQTLRKRPEFKVNEVVLQSPKQASSDTDSLENTSPEFLYIFHNLEAAERQMSAVFKVLSTHN